MKMIAALCVVSWMVILLQGCGGSNAGASVSGVVTLDGQPLKDVIVTFQREEGSVSTGVTNQQGFYQLRSSVQQAGATPGKYKVSIAPVPPGDDVDPRDVVEVKIPDRYRSGAELTAEVTSGSNVVNFSLESK